jgi:hypothetical protein
MKEVPSIPCDISNLKSHKLKFALTQAQKRLLI